MKKISLALALILFSAFISAEIVTINQNPLSFEAVESTDNRTTIEINLGSFHRTPVEIDGETYYHVQIEPGRYTLEEGYPELPKLTRSIIIPDEGLMDVRVIHYEYTEIEMNIVPSKGNLIRTQIPSEVPYTFGDVYSVNEFYPSEIVSLSDPYILRDFRGTAVSVYPVTYNPVTGIARVYTNIVFEVNNVGVDNVNIKHRTRDGYMRDFETIYKNRFINFSETRYVPLEERGRILVIAYDDFYDAMIPYVEWKTQKGIRTDMYPKAEVGQTAQAIKDFIQVEYDLDDGLTFVLLVGDAPQIPTFMVGGGGSDPAYSLLEGNDSYPDIFVGRFSAETVQHVETQVERTIHYERDVGNEDWLNKGTGIASNEGSNPSDDEHLDAIRDLLLAYTYVHVDQFYQPQATSAQVTNAVNDGRSFINYTGHGSTTSWHTSGFNNGHVNALVNDYMQPFIVTVACVNGNFTSATCFAEAWLRATNNTTGDPTGASAMYASSRNQAWVPPMIAQDEIVDLLVEDQKNTIGGLFFNGSCEMMDVFGNSGVTEFMNWIIFGDPSLQVRTDIPEEMAISYIPSLIIGMTTFDVSTDVEDALVSLTYEGEILAAGYTDSDGFISLELEEPPLIPGEVTLTITAYNKITYVSTIPLIASEGPFVVYQGYTITGEDADYVPHYGQLVGLDLTLNNVGVDPAEQVTGILASNDPYVEIINPVSEFGFIDTEEPVVIENAFQVQFADNIPNKHRVSFALNLDWEDDQISFNFNIDVHAPEFYVGEIVIYDMEPGGNNDGILDPGETATILIPTQNVGDAVSPDTFASLFTSSPYLTIQSNPNIELGEFQVGQLLQVPYTVVLSEDIPDGVGINLGFLVESGNYSTQETFPLFVYTNVEDFETGDFSSLDWHFSGHADWIIVSDNVYEGQYSARSGTITHNQNTSMSVTMDILADGEISFYKMVSSENNYDFLRFFINDQQQATWSGTNDSWSQVSFPVSAGVNTFRWTYDKDHIVTAGQDCGWIDYIEFPNIGLMHEGPFIASNTTSIDLGTVLVQDFSTDKFLIINFGDEVLEGAISFPDFIGLSCGGDEGYLRNPNQFEYTVDPYETMEVSISFSPQEHDIYNGEILITSNDENNPEMTIAVTGKGFLPQPPQALEADLAVGEVHLTWEEPDYGYSLANVLRDRFNNKMIYRDVALLGYNVYRDNELITEDYLYHPEYIDYDVAPETTYSYYVTAVYTLGESPSSNEIVVLTLFTGEELSSLVTSLGANYPNPFNPDTTIHFNLKETSNVKLDIFNVLGQKVITLTDEEFSQGSHSLIWNGLNHSGASVGSGVYFYRMETDDYQAIKKMILMK